MGHGGTMARRGIYWLKSLGSSFTRVLGRLANARRHAASIRVRSFSHSATLASSNARAPSPFGRPKERNQARRRCESLDRTSASSDRRHQHGASPSSMQARQLYSRLTTGFRPAGSPSMLRTCSCVIVLTTAPSSASGMFGVLLASARRGLSA
jgi:hypothetical protein